MNRRFFLLLPICVSVGTVSCLLLPHLDTKTTEQPINSSNYGHSSEDKLVTVYCPYLDLEILRRINKKEISNIVEIGTHENGLNAVQLHLHYQCSVFTFEWNSERFSSIKENINNYPRVVLVPYKAESSSSQCLIRLDDWMKKNKLNTIDLLCIDVPNIQNILCGLGASIEKIKYLVLGKKYLSQETKEYLEQNGFKTYFYNVSLFDSALFINKKTKENMTHSMLRDFNTVKIAPLITGNINSEIIHAAYKNNHEPFHNLSTFKDLDINAQDANGNSAFIAAAANNSSYPLEKLMQQNYLDFGLQNKNGCTALMAAVTAGHVVIINLILEDPRGFATIDMQNNLGMTAEEIAYDLHIAEIADLIHHKKHKLDIEPPPSLSEYPQNVIHERVLVCGVCKDIEPQLPCMMKIMEKVGGLFDDYKIVVYENNSTDNTKNLLRNWMNNNGKVEIMLESLTQDELSQRVINRHDDGSFFKVELIARARNIVLNHIRSKKFDDYRYLIMFDMDFNLPPPAESIIEIFQSKREWDGVFAYGVGSLNQFWDWYAFRDYNEPFGPELLGYDWFGPKHWSLFKTDQWCPVYSACGGCAIYKRESIKDCWYSGLVTPDLEEVSKKIMLELKESDHPVILKYLNDIKSLSFKANIFHPRVQLERITDRSVAIVLREAKDALIWRMNSFVYQYPVTCDTVAFHAAMILRGHGKLFINPRFILKYH